MEVKEITIVADGRKFTFIVTKKLGKEMDTLNTKIKLKDTGAIKFEFEGTILYFDECTEDEDFIIEHLDTHLITACALCLLNRPRLRNIIMGKYARLYHHDWEWLRQIEERKSEWVKGKMWKW